jgi:hypothetical protein
MAEFFCYFWGQALPFFRNVWIYHWYEVKTYRKTVPQKLAKVNEIYESKVLLWKKCSLGSVITALPTDRAFWTFWNILSFLYSPKIFFGKHTVAVVSVRPSSYLLNLSSEIDVVHNRSLCYRQYMQYVRYGPLGQPSPETGNCWISKKLLRSPLKLIYSCSLCYRQICNTLDMVPVPPPHGKLLNISKTIEIPTPKAYIFLFLVSRNIWWYIDDDHTGWSCPSFYRNCPNISKTVSIPTPTPYNPSFLCHLMVGRSWPYGVVPSPWNRKCPNIWKTIEIPTPNHDFNRC